MLLRVDAEDQIGGERDVDAHPGFERAQLLQPLALLEDPRWQRDIALERGAAIGVEADMEIMLAGTRRQARSE